MSGNRLAECFLMMPHIGLMLIIAELSMSLTFEMTPVLSPQRESNTLTEMILMGNMILSYLSRGYKRNGKGDNIAPLLHMQV